LQLVVNYKSFALYIIGNKKLIFISFRNLCKPPTSNKKFQNSIFSLENCRTTNIFQNKQSFQFHFFRKSNKFFRVQIRMAGRGVDLKNEEEVKEYLENLGIEYRFGCYHEKSPKGKTNCNSLNLCNLSSVFDILLRLTK
jgi:hypothetical protein